MIERFIKEGTSPKFDMLIIDEAQDLVPLQWKMVKEVWFLIQRSLLCWR